MSSITINKPPAMWQLPFDRYTLALVSGLSAVVLWRAMLPSFYYMRFIFFLTMLWGSISLALSIRVVIALVGTFLTKRAALWTGWRSVVLLPAVVTLLVAFKAPMHLGFAFARPALDQVIKMDFEPSGSFSISKASVGPYSIYQQANRDCHDKSRIYFTLSNDVEAGFVYSTTGIDDLCYNSGSKGHLSGNWYWMAED